LNVIFLHQLGCWNIWKRNYISLHGSMKQANRSRITNAV
jgi:hypothetical protein